MKKIILAITIVFAVVSCKVDSKNKVETSDAAKVNTSEGVAYVVNTEKSILNWEGYKPTGKHNGSIAISEGVLDVSDDKLIGGKFTIDMNSIVVLDMPVGDHNAKLVGHLKNADFFDVEKFATASFEITAVTPTNVSGNLQVKGISKNITIPAKFAIANGFVTFKSEAFKIDRTEFGIEYKSTKLADVIKDKSIDDLFEMSFDVIAKK